MSEPPPAPVERVALPPGAEPPLRVFVNGEERVEGEDWTLEGGAIRFASPLRPKPPLGMWRSIVLSLGIGVYGDLRADQLDVMFQRSGRQERATLPITPA
jgi:hypothetical protein